ncbi:hypothetical protein [Acinetobacter chinensis]|uniref:hypothetical protein n=1 Tax=Acinetobacter chinensis TaxID=2004650 RepID=UPI002934BE8D|nr:hypothetical protein [Acinetobacter chinensis]WOE40748.1 hypothetical protein QSG87_12750 [Acinetobacter chinensis]
MAEQMVKCCRCRNKHLESERLKKPSNKYGCWGEDLVCPRCACTTFYRLEKVEKIQEQSHD